MNSISILEVLVISIPLIVLSFVFYLIVIRLTPRNEKSEINELQKIHRIEALPIKLQALERLALFLERITPESLIERVDQQNMDTRSFHKSLIQQVRLEYQHNISQQIYVSSNTWAQIVLAKESIIKLLNTTLEEVGPESTTIVYSTELLNEYFQAENTPIKNAQNHLRNELETKY